MSKSWLGRTAGKLPGAAMMAAVSAGLALSGATPATAVNVSSPLASLAGRWVGEGRLGIKGNPTEQVKCRVNYVFAKADDQLKQSIRCASAGGHVEVQSLVSHAAGKLTGTWQERVRNWSGKLSGTVTPRGFKVSVRGETLNANMDIIVIDKKQIVEIQFINSTLVGLTLVLQRG
ncbi:MAG TPA: hypothetical protein VFZ16_20795 [Hyphomicrobiaceae bacterium]|nr:hypothetical protein [Hyphomicrobiaceae bacterium]